MPLSVGTSSSHYEVTHSSGSCCRVCRADASVSVHPVNVASPTTGVPVHAVLGLLPLTAVAVLILVTGRERVASLPCGAALWRVTATELRTTDGLLGCAEATAEASAADAQYLALLRAALAEPWLMFISRGDATRRAGSASSSAAGCQCRWDGVSLNFAWNAHLAQPLLAAGAGAFCPPVVCGWAGERTTHSTPPLRVSLLLRRHCGRPGRRLWTRGLDTAGAAANSVESEQLLLRPGAAETTAFTQLRGSVPLLWSQPPTLAGKPPILLSPGPHSAAAHRAHYATLAERYGTPILSLSLLKATGREAALGNAFAAAAAEEPSAAGALIAFDFTAEGGASEKGRAAMLAMLAPHLRSIGITHVRDGRVLRSQAGVVRTNCLDCLDRSNLAETEMGCAAAMQQMDALDVCAEQRAEALSLLRSLWGVAGDAVSLQYTGTAAQRRDRSARLSRASALAWLRDAAISAARYVLNNHADARLCDAAALVSGAHVPSSRASPFPRGAFGRAACALKRLPALQAAALYCAFRAASAAWAVPLLQGDAMHAGAAAAAWATVAAALTHLALTHGAAFVARPLLASKEASAS